MIFLFSQSLHDLCIYFFLIMINLRYSILYICFRTKIMIKHPQTLFEIENRFQASKNLLATIIQSAWRGCVARKRYMRIRALVIYCQIKARMRLRYRRSMKLRAFEIVTQKIIFIQKNIRRLLAVRAYNKTRNAGLTIIKY